MGLTKEFGGGPFNIVLVAGGTTEDGKSMGGIADLTPILAQAIHTYCTSVVGFQATTLANNAYGLLTRETEEGLCRLLSTLGFMRGTFDIAAILRKYLVPHLASQALRVWVNQRNPEAALNHESDAANLCQVSTDVVFMRFAQTDDQGMSLTPQYERELIHAWQKQMPRAQDLPESIVTADQAQRTRNQANIDTAEHRLGQVACDYADYLTSHARQLLNSDGPSAARDLIDFGTGRLSTLNATLSTQREELALQAAEADNIASRALQHLTDRIKARRLFGKAYGTELADAVSALDTALRLRFAMDLTEAGIRALSEAHAQLIAFQGALERLATIMNNAAGQLHDEATSFATRTPSPSDEIIERPLYRLPDLQALYSGVMSCDWAELSASALATLRMNLGNLDGWLNAPVETVLTDARRMSDPLLHGISNLSADDFVAWQARNTDQTSEQILHNLIGLAPLLTRTDKASLPEADGVYDSSFTLVGVANRDTTPFAGTSQAMLVSTGDPTNIVVLRLEMGIPTSALWNYETMKRSAEALANNGTLIPNIYPGLRDEDPPPSTRRGRRPRA